MEIQDRNRLIFVMLLTILGVDRVNLTLSIHPDNIPEINEVFTVELTNVTERNERIRAGAVCFY